MKLISKCESILKIIPNSAKLQHICIISNKDSDLNELELLICYELQEGYIIILKACIDYSKEPIFNIAIIA